ncbi:MAG: hypothetical protein U0795_27210 [Pirellulales bacterium]
MSTANEPSKDRWERIVVPTAKGLEAFFWKLVWFLLLVFCLFGWNLVALFRPTDSTQGDGAARPSNTAVQESGPVEPEPR